MSTCSPALEPASTAPGPSDEDLLVTLFGNALEWQQPEDQDAETIDSLVCGCPAERLFRLWHSGQWCSLPVLVDRAMAS
jgi:hypothetical protein